MAQKVAVELVDDLDGTVSDDITTIAFTLDGVSFEIDLAEHNATALRDAFADFIRTGGRAKRGVSPAGTRPTAADREKTKAIRDWARQNGQDIAERGRIPATIVQAFEEAQAAPPKPKARRRRAKTPEPAFSG
jgi:hypothetical protein